MRMRDNVYQIKKEVSMSRLLEAYGFRLNSNRAIRCPFHNEKTASFVVHPTNQYAHCFGCGANTDVIEFVCRYEQCDFNSACKKIDTMFQLGIYQKPTLTAYRRRKKEISKINETETAHKSALDAVKSEYYDALDRWIAADQIVRNCSPGSAIYADAVKRIDFRSYLLDEAQNKLYHAERGKT